ncbi:hypothetical protein D3C80_1863950 [compost metagenome]
MRLAGDKALHIPVLFIGRLTAMNHSHIILRIGEVCFDLLVIGNQALIVQLITLIDQWVYNIDLPPFFNFIFDEFHDLEPVHIESVGGVNRLTSRR